MKAIKGFCGYKNGLVCLLILLYALMEIINLILAGSTLNLLLTIPQIFIVVFFIFKQDYRKAFLLHMLFIAVSFDPTSILTEGALYSYGKIKLVGPIGFVHVLMGVFFVVVKSKYSIRCKDTMIYKAYILLRTLYFIGIGVGLIGFFVNRHYTISGFITPFVYMTTGIIHLNILLRLYDEKYTKLFFFNAWILLVGSTLATSITFMLGYSATYSTDDVYLYNELYLLVPCLIIAILQFNNKFVILVSIGCMALFVYNVMSGGARGVTFMTMLLSIIMFIYVLYTKKHPRFFEKLLKGLLPVILIVGLPSLIIIFQNSGGLSARKFESFLTLFSLFDFSTDFFTKLSFISESPYIRIAECIDIVDNYINDFVSIPFGRGYGGYYTDSLGLFADIDLTRGAFPAEVVSTGRFPSAHSVYPSALLFNGFIGLYLIIRFGIEYMKKTKCSYLCYAGIMLFCYSLYFNPLFFLASIFCLYGAEYQINNYEKNIIY